MFCPTTKPCARPVNGTNEKFRKLNSTNYPQQQPFVAKLLAGYAGQERSDQVLCVLDNNDVQLIILAELLLRSSERGRR